MIMEGAGIASKGASGKSAGISLVDVGGPGGSVFGSMVAAELASGWPTRERLLFIEEPWVTRAVPPACRDSLQAFQRGVRSAGPVETQARTLVATCDLRSGGWGWTRQLYSQVAQAIVAKEGGRLSGVLASSYGAIRTREVQQTASDWLILNSPAPRHRDGRAYLAERERLARLSLAKACKGCSEQDLRTTLNGARSAFAEKEVPLPYRTPPVTAIDFDAALLGAAYLPDNERVAFLGKLRTDKSKAAVSIGKQSDSLLLRYGDYAMSAGYLAYFDEVCRDYGPWKTSKPTSSVNALMQRLHAPCEFLGGPATTAESPVKPVRTCVATGLSDYVVPEQAAKEWAALVPGAQRVTLRGIGHGDPLLATACAKRLFS